METRRLKNIAILILALLNVFLLVILGYQELQGRQISRDTVEGLRELLASEEMTLLDSADVMQESLLPLTLVRQKEKENAIAAFLLGETVAQESQGGGIQGYNGTAGMVQFRAGGGFDTVRFSRVIEDIPGFAGQFCEKFGYKNAVINIAGGNGTVTATQYLAGVPIYGCGVTLTFQNGCMVSAVGANVGLSDAATDSEDPLSCVSALVSLMDYRRSAGIMCSEVRGVRCIYQLQTTSSAPRLLPIWEIETDTYTFLVDGVTGTVSRK